MADPTAETGFAVLPDVLSARELRQLSEALDVSHFPGSRAGARHLMSYAPVAALASDPRLLRIARRCVGPGAIPYKATLFDKSPSRNWLIVWHQDTALPLRERGDRPGWGPWSTKAGLSYAHAPASALSRIVALRVHLDDSGSDNGPLRVLPGTHTRGVLTDDDVTELARVIRGEECLVPAGGVIAMRPLLVHASSKVSVDHPRRVLHIEYAPSLTVEAGLDLALA